MIKQLALTNVGPASKMELEFSPRLNLFTGDNGLGKSFLLDIAWWSLTRKWPREVNPKLTSGGMAIPTAEGIASITFEFTGKVKQESYTSNFIRKEQIWRGRPGRPANPGLVLYAMTDGSFAVWDPHRNYWLSQANGDDIQERTPAYVFSPTEVWDGLAGSGNASLCNGLIRDWASWQKENGVVFKQLKKVLKTLSPSEKELIEPGDLTRLGLDDVRDIPTIRMPYQKDVAVVHASSGMKRIIALAYVLVWAWEEHKKAAQLLDEQITNQITFLVDEIEAHLHPSWQRKIVPTLIEVMNNLSKNAQVQLIAATHSPLVMTSIEPIFDYEQDAWFDLDFVRKKVVLTHRQFEKHGEVNNWLVSEAFDLPSTRSLEAESLIKKAAKLLDGENPPNPTTLENTHKKLVEMLNPRDSFLFRWRAICERKGWLE
ncbi:TPA: AAA family ATPase [Vibrio vulnificus]|nr:AAA family ATPase [Vibrio vulnificus]HAS6423762.1 AAA family ATPase [Vibrio vulnificus]